MSHGDGVDLQADLRNTLEEKVFGWMLDGRYPNVV